MKQPKHMRAQMGALLKSCVDVAEQVSVSAVRTVMSKVDGAKHNGPAQRMVDAIAQGTEKLIAKSPVPIPAPVREALDRMQEALGQLSNSIEVVNAGASSLSKDPKGMDPTRRQAMDDARAAFVDLEASEGANEGAENKKPRRHRSRRSNHRQGDEQSTSQSARKDRGDQTPNG